MALGALATAATFVLVLINQKGTQKQIDSLSQMAEMFSRHYQFYIQMCSRFIYYNPVHFYRI